jgi:hypothetical protein
LHTLTINVESERISLPFTRAQVRSIRTSASQKAPGTGAFEREPNYLAIVDELAQLPGPGPG